MMRPLPFANRLDRLLANVIDSVVMVAPVALLISIAGEDSLLANVGGFACNIAYYVAFTASRWQATPGKRLMGIYVVRNDGKLLNERDALERFLGYVIPTLPLYLTIAPPNVLGMATIWLSLAWYLPILLRDDKRGVHDVLCGTAVVSGKR